MNRTAQRTIPAPLRNPENEPYFAAAEEGKLLVGKCSDCSDYHFFPRTICPHCNSDSVEWLPSNGKGVIYSFSTMRRGVPVPYTIAYVTLDEGVSMMTNIVNADPDSLNIGDKVEVVFEPTEDGTPLPVFQPLSS